MATCSGLDPVAHAADLVHDRHRRARRDARESARGRRSSDHQGQARRGRRGRDDRGDSLDLWRHDPDRCQRSLDARGQRDDLARARRATRSNSANSRFLPGRRSGCAGFASASPIPIVTDEDAKDAGDLPALAGCVDGVNVKLVKCGGIRARAGDDPHRPRAGFEDHAGLHGRERDSLDGRRASLAAGRLGRSRRPVPASRSDPVRRHDATQRGKIVLPHGPGLGVASASRRDAAPAPLRRLRAGRVRRRAPPKPRTASSPTRATRSWRSSIREHAGQPRSRRRCRTLHSDAPIVASVQRELALRADRALDRNRPAGRRAAAGAIAQEIAIGTARAARDRQRTARVSQRRRSSCARSPTRTIRASGICACRRRRRSFRAPPTTSRAASC